MSAIACLQKRISRLFYSLYIERPISGGGRWTSDASSRDVITFCVTQSYAVGIFSCCCVTLYLYRATHSKNG